MKDNNILHYWGKAQLRAKGAGEEMLRKFGNFAKSIGFHNVSLILGVSNSPGEFLCNLVERYKIDYLLVGRRGLGKVERLLVGSASRYCVEHAKCNVIVIKGNYIHEDKKKPLETYKSEAEEKLPILEWGF